MNNRIGFGTGGISDNSLCELIKKSLEIGYRLFDTAECYNNEHFIGNAISDSDINRESLCIISKYAPMPNGNIEISLTESLKKLKIDYIDIYLIHLPFLCIPNCGWQALTSDVIYNHKYRIEIWKKMIELKNKGYVKSIGVSNWSIYNIEELKSYNLPLPEYLEIEWCPNYYDKDLLDYCRANKVKVIAYGSLIRTVTTIIPEIDNYCKDNNITYAQLLLKWSLDRGIICIPRSRNIDHIRENYNTSYKDITLPENIMHILDNYPKYNKGHSLDNVFNVNDKVNLWKPLFMNNESIQNKNSIKPLNKLINGEISCIIINNVLSKDECTDIINTLNKNNVWGKFARCSNEFGITIDSPHYNNNDLRYNSEIYWKYVNQFNNYCNDIFNGLLNPINVFFNTITSIIEDEVTIKYSTNENIESKGIFRLKNNRNGGFPYHTDGFNQGRIINNRFEWLINRNVYPDIMTLEIDTNSVIGIILVLNKPSVNNNKSEIELYNCLIDDLEKYDNELGLYSHWYGTKYKNIELLEKIIFEKPYYFPIVNTGDMYIFSASRIHKVISFEENEQENRVVLASFGFYNKQNNTLKLAQ
jgi:diketogulonate reductase-like aldo/keto reductase